MAAADEAELVHMVATQVAHDEGPSALRYPRGDGVGVEMPEAGVPLPIGKGRILREARTVAILSLGTRLAEAMKAATELQSFGLSTTVADARFAKPARHRPDQPPGARARGADHHRGRLDRRLRQPCRASPGDRRPARFGFEIRPMVLPDRFLDHDNPMKQYDEAGLNARHITATALAALGRTDAVLPVSA